MVYFSGILRKCSASGTRIFFPQISGVGILRQRYPIMPIHGEGSSVWKELEATKDLLLKSKTNGYIFREPLSGGDGSKPTEPTKPLRYQMMPARRTPPGAHTHDVIIAPDEVEVYLYVYFFYNLVLFCTASIYTPRHTNCSHCRVFELNWPTDL